MTQAATASNVATSVGDIVMVLWLAYWYAFVDQWLCARAKEEPLVAVRRRTRRNAIPLAERKHKSVWLEPPHTFHNAAQASSNNQATNSSIEAASSRSVFFPL